MSTTPVLGITVSSQTVVGVLVDQRDDGPAVVRTMYRSRSSSAAKSASQKPRVYSPETSAEEDPDVHFSTAGGGGDLFLAGEFSIGGPAASTPGVVGTPVAPSTVEFEVKELVAECAEAGFPKVQVVFATGMPYLNTHEIRPSRRDEGEGEKSDRKKRGDRAARPGRGRKRSARHDALVRQLVDEVDGPVNQDAVLFLAMTPTAENEERFLAVYARPDEPLLPTLRQLEQRGRGVPNVDLVDTEVSLLLGLGRMAAPAEEAGRRRRLVLRVGIEDAVALYLDGQRLHHFEKLRSITVYDPPETIGSRILLLQDEYGIGEADEILVLSEENEEALIAFLSDFFPNSDVRGASSLLPPYPGDPAYRWSRQAALAASAALRAIHERGSRSLFETVNLAPGRSRRRRGDRKGVAWQVYAMFGLLFGMSLFFVARYMAQQHDIDMAELRLSQFSPEEIERSVGSLESRIDSIQNRIDGFIYALDVLDSLLVGSDKWSRQMEHTAAQTASVPGIWVETWTDQESTLELVGNATSRDQIVRLATRMDGVIESVTFSEIREWPVYSFRMTVPVTVEIPEAARFLREQAASVPETATVPVRQASDPAPPSPDEATSK
jgi:hypothetical protein